MADGTVRSLADLLDTTLPLNRKERYFTGTVLPGLLGEDLRNLRLLGELLDAPGLVVRSDPADCTVLLFTEYGLAESLSHAGDRFPALPATRDTPDVVILVTEPEPILIALEAKLYDTPGGHELQRQLDAQAELLLPLRERLAELLEVPRVPVRHVALLPEALAGRVTLAPYPVLTWERVAAHLGDAAPAYWLAVLTEALARYPSLVSKAVSNAAAGMSGAAIVDGYLAGELPYLAVGRQGGRQGGRLGEDIASGTWRGVVYQVAHALPPGNGNWLPVEQLVDLLREAGQVADDPVGQLQSAVASAMGILTRVGADGSVAARLVGPGAREALRAADPARLRDVAHRYAAAAEAARQAREAASALVDLVPSADHQP